MMLSLLKKHSLITTQMMRPRSFFVMQQPVRYFFATPVMKMEIDVNEVNQTEVAVVAPIKTDEISFYIQTKLQTVQKLQEFEQEKQQELTLRHRSILLAKLYSLLSEQSESMSANSKISVQNTFHNLAQSILKTKTIMKLDQGSLISTLGILAKGNERLPINIIRPDKGKLIVIEEHIQAKFDIYLERDISVVISSLMKLQHTPMKLLNKLNKMEAMSIFNKDQCVRMLEALAENPDVGDEKESELKMELFEKFFDQLELHSSNINSYNVCRALYCLESLIKAEKIMTSRRELVSLKKKVEFLISRFADMLYRDANVPALDLYWSNKFVNTIQKILIKEIGDTAGYKPLDLRQLQLYSVQELKDKLHEMEPKLLVNMMHLFSDNERYMSMLVQKTMECLKQEKIDIRTFQLYQLSEFVNFVAIYDPKEVKVFFNYVVNAFESGFFTISATNFRPMSQIFVMFVKNGYLSPDQHNKFYFSFLLGLKQIIFPSRGIEAKMDSRDIIKITWSLITMQEAGNLTIPLLPKLLEQLQQFDRPGEPLTQEELLMLHQINIYSQDLVSKNRLPAAFLKIFPEDVREIAQEVWDNWDQSLYPDVQKEIAIKLLKLRVEFKENTRPLAANSQLEKSILNQFKVPFRLVSTDKATREGKVFLLKGEKNVNTDTDQWHAFHGFVVRLLQEGAPPAKSRHQESSASLLARRQKAAKLDVRIIDVDHWRTLGEVDKMQLLNSLLQAPIDEEGRRMRA